MESHLDHILEYLFLKTAGAKEGVDYKKGYQVFFAREADPLDQRILITLDTKEEARALCEALQRRDPAYVGKYFVYNPETKEKVDVVQVAGTVSTGWRYMYPK